MKKKRKRRKKTRVKRLYPLETQKTNNHVRNPIRIFGKKWMVCSSIP